MGINEQEELLCTLVMKMDKEIEYLRKLLSKVRGGKMIDEAHLSKIMRKFNHAKGQG